MGTYPALTVILVGEDAASQVYVRNKVQSIRSRVEWADIAITKTTAIPAASGVEIRMARSRTEYEVAFRTILPNVVCNK